MDLRHRVAAQRRNVAARRHGVVEARARGQALRKERLARARRAVQQAVAEGRAVGARVRRARGDAQQRRLEGRLEGRAAQDLFADLCARGALRRQEPRQRRDAAEAARRLAHERGLAEPRLDGPCDDARRPARHGHAERGGGDDGGERDHALLVAEERREGRARGPQHGPSRLDGGVARHLPLLAQHGQLQVVRVALHGGVRRRARGDVLGVALAPQVGLESRRLAANRLHALVVRHARRLLAVLERLLELHRGLAAVVGEV
mmetsp:Transcript_10247/g.36095  ORF Transcript_10247/g.36095 Transcript_10247/m.36095 type:complete len:262 (+) Transcript_10247:621-1406(+)